MPWRRLSWFTFAAVTVPASEQRRREGGPADRRWYRRENWYRDVWLLLITALLLWAVSSIQANRLDAARNSCIAQNGRNVDTIRQLEQVVRKLPPRQRQRAVANIGSTVLLINALAPFHKDCDSYADAVVAGKPVPRGQARPLPPGLRAPPVAGP